MRILHFLLPLAGLLLVSSCQTTSRKTAAADKDLFEKADTDKNGTLSQAEFTAVALPRRFERFDRDGDGSVTLAEARLTAPGFDERKFQERDLNHDGKVTFEEYRKVATSKGLLKAKFRELDTNHDGVIDKAEADAYAAKLNKAPATPAKP